MLTAGGRVVDSLAMQSIGYPLLALACAGLLLGALTGPADSLPGLLWRSGPMRYVGRRSYAIYVLHPLLYLIVLRRGFDGQYFARLFGSQLLGVAWFAVLMTSLAVGVATLSWYAYEEPFLRLKAWFPMDRADRSPASLEPALLEAPIET
jgi:peptidoglycan/LPS O-acetylase OafA/YrhL